MQLDGKPLLDLPVKTVLLHKVKLFPHEQEVYDHLAREAKSTVERYIEEGTLVWRSFQTIRRPPASHCTSAAHRHDRAPGYSSRST